MLRGRASNPQCLTGTYAASTLVHTWSGAPGRNRISFALQRKRTSAETSFRGAPCESRTRLSGLEDRVLTARTTVRAEAEDGIEPLIWRLGQWRAAEGSNLAGRIWSPARSQIAAQILRAMRELGWTARLELACQTFTASGLDSSPSSTVRPEEIESSSPGYRPGALPLSYRRSLVLSRAPSRSRTWPFGASDQRSSPRELPGQRRDWRPATMCSSSVVKEHERSDRSRGSAGNRTPFARLRAECLAIKASDPANTRTHAPRWGS
jgi:hypothetical protein